MSDHTVITIVCCVCKRVIGYTEGYGMTGVSHGYCPKCEEDILKAEEMKK